MDLFGAATKGVDPQTGSYLSKEQRIAMFRASRGMGGGNSGGGSGTNKRARVSAQSSIVAVNKMASITQTLQSNYQQATNSVAEQVARNTQSIQDLYNTVYQQRKQKLLAEKEQTKDALAAREKSRFALREKLVEGISSALAGLVSPIQKAASATLKPVLSFWDKLKRALLALAGAWIIDNIPAIKKSLDFAFDAVKNLFNTIKESPKSIRGIYSIIDNLFSGAFNLIKRLVKFSYNIGKKILKASANVARKIVTSVGNFVRSLAGRIGKALSGLWENITKTFKKPPKPPTNKPQLPPAKKAGPKTKGFKFTTPQWLRNLGRNIRGGVQNVGDVLSKGKESLGKVGGTIRSNIGNAFSSMGIKPSTDAAKEGWIKRALTPLEKIPVLKGLLGKAGGLAKGLLKKVPIVGTAIDIFLNRKIEGQDWTQAIIRGLFSGAGGSIGAVGGAKVGAFVGGAAGSVVPVVGTAIGAGLGAALGGLLGSMIVGAVGDKAGEMTYEKFTGLPAKPNIVTDGILDAATKVTKAVVEGKGSDVETINIKPKQERTTQSSTPDGMENVSQSGLDKTTSIIDMPPVFTKIPMQQSPAGSEDSYIDIPTISTIDSESDFYRSLAMTKYDLAFSGN